MYGYGAGLDYYKGNILISLMTTFLGGDDNSEEWKKMLGMTWTT